MYELNSINALKTVSKAQEVHAALYTSHVQRVGEKQAAHAVKMAKLSASYKEGGLAWWKWLCVCVARDLIDLDAKVNHFIPASPETIEWGGFLGGERVIFTDKAAEADAQEMINGRIAGL